MNIIKCVECPKCKHLIKMGANNIVKQALKKPYKSYKKLPGFGRNNKHWTPSEDKYMWDFYKIAGAKQIANALKRTPQAVTSRAWVLGIKRHGGKKDVQDKD